jgi:ribosomal protein S18 acetylase RimI-like enzyme
MAALSDRHPLPLIELRRVAPDHLTQLLAEETSDWSEGLDWDFRPSADLVRRFVQMHSLSGFALLYGARIVGYSYFVCEEGKGLIGDLYILREHRTLENENLLFRAMLDALWRVPGIRRVEAQLMMLSSPLQRTPPYQNWFHAYPRYFLEGKLAAAVTLPPRVPRNILISSWLEDRQEETARLIANAYEGHVDSQINDQYRSPAGARRFLTNIVQYPGCGTFFGPASFAATDLSSGVLHGVALASLVARDVGHITQVCVAPSHQGTGLGYELLRRSLLALAAHGCRSASLTVTASNDTAIRLYQRMGFEKIRDFAAYVWEQQ